MADADLVLEGRGVKALSLVGAITALAAHDDPYTFHRVAGTSAGAIVGSLLAAGLPVAELKAELDRLDFTRFEEKPKRFTHLPEVGAALGLLFKEGMYRGEFLRQWITDMLAARNVRTWADLRQDDPGSALPPEQRYKLVVVVSDVSRGLMLRLPWDYRKLLGVDPDAQPVADAVLASASIPFFFEPVRMSVDTAVAGTDHIVCTDGGMLSTYPINIFDRLDGKPARWPTFGVRPSVRTGTGSARWSPDAGDLQLAKALLSKMQGAHDRMYVSDPSFASRTIFVDTTGYSATDFQLSKADRTKLFTSGLSHGQRFLARWDWAAWKQGDFRALLASWSDTAGLPPRPSGPPARPRPSRA